VVESVSWVSSDALMSEGRFLYLLERYFDFVIQICNHL